MIECPNCDAALVGRRTCPACDPQRPGLVRKILAAIGVAGWLAWTNVRERMPQRRAEDGRSWWHTVVACTAIGLAIFTASLLGRCIGMKVTEYRANATATEAAVDRCERMAVAMGESTEGCKP
jgi:hypothetical protein